MRASQKHVPESRAWDKRCCHRRWFLEPHTESSFLAVTPPKVWSRMAGGKKEKAGQGQGFWGRGGGRRRFEQQTRFPTATPCGVFIASSAPQGPRGSPGRAVRSTRYLTPQDQTTANQMSKGSNARAAERAGWAVAEGLPRIHGPTSVAPKGPMERAAFDALFAGTRPRRRSVNST